MNVAFWIKFVIIFSSLMIYFFVGSKFLDEIFKQICKEKKIEKFDISYIVLFWLPILLFSIIKNIIKLSFNYIGKLAYNIFNKKER